ncbi:hypothetical protein IFR05_004421 [Cadophora sp. M221]|nr:hypothetical protein IFR05_004421 [Cadophora sp. M221]
MFAFIVQLSLALNFALAIPAATTSHPKQWPHGPFTTKGTQIINSAGDPFVYVGMNWPGEGEVMIPEGLQYSSISEVISKIKSLGMNSVRMGWATEMVDDILDNGGDVSIADALNKVLGSKNGTTILAQIIKHNPKFSSRTTRLQVWDEVAAELQRQQLHLIFNNHVSKAVWCCNPTDGNGWFDDIYFDVRKWRRSLKYMAKYAKKNWPAATALSLRNELRQVSNPIANATYGWSRWYDQMTAAAEEVHAANPEALIFLSGLNYDHELNPITAAQQLSPTDQRVFNLSDFKYANKIVFELHTYDNWMTNCTFFQSELYSRGFNVLDISPESTAVNHAPVLFTEFGFAQNGSDYLGVYAQCLKDFVTGEKRLAEANRIEGGIGWLQWTIGGSYYSREGIQDFDDWWAILNHDWSNWRNETVIDNYQRPMVQGVLAA